MELGLNDKIWSKKVVNLIGFINYEKNMDNDSMRQGFDITNIGKNMFQFQFFH